MESRGRRVGQMDEMGGQELQTFSYKISKSWGGTVQSGDYR